VLVGIVTIGSSPPKSYLQYRRFGGDGVLFALPNLNGFVTPGPGPLPVVDRIRGRAWSLLNGRRVAPDVIEAYGWPFRCLRWESFGLASSGAVSFGVPPYKITLKRSSTPVVTFSNHALGRTVLPLRPIWHGLFLNLALYSLTVTYLFVVATQVRGWTRRRKGNCSACGYSLRGVSSVCPECGTPFRSHAEPKQH
jgi:hypothetical protein